MAQIIAGNPHQGSSMNALRTLSVFVVTHLVIPGAIVLMVCAFLFFLIDVRAVLFPGAELLKGVGFFFVVATVLIVRYGRMYQETERKYLYLAALAASTGFSMSYVSDNAGLGRLAIWGGTMVDLVIVAAVWWLATAVTHCLSLDEEAHDTSGLEGLRIEDADSSGPRLAVTPASLRAVGTGSRQSEPAGPRPATASDAPVGGVEQGRAGRPRHLHRPPRGRPAVPPGGASAWYTLARTAWRAILGRRGGDAHGNPARAVIRLALVALVAFALGEPLIMSGAPEIGPDALLAMVAFLFATGLLLAAGSAVGMLRHASSRGGTVSLELIPLRVFSGGALLVLVLSVGLAMPGVQYRGSGVLHARPWDPTTPARDLAEKIEARARAVDPEAADPAEETRRAPARGAPGRRDSEQGEAEQGGEDRDAAPPSDDPAPADGGVLASLTRLGATLLVPLLAIAGLFGLLTLVRLRPLWTGWRHRAERWLAALAARLRSALDRLRHHGDITTSDPLEGWEQLDMLAPTDAVRGAYGRFMALTDALGHPRPPRLTPLEFLRTLPLELRAHTRELRTLTELYVRAAYSPAGVDREEKARALEVLRSLHAVQRRHSDA
jgi:putative effector of murein hydrolase LrgA (UPF0299 family)